MSVSGRLVLAVYFVKSKWSGFFFLLFSFRKPSAEWITLNIHLHGLWSQPVATADGSSPIAPIYAQLPVAALSSKRPNRNTISCQPLHLCPAVCSSLHTAYVRLWWISIVIRPLQLFLLHFTTILLQEIGTLLDDFIYMIVEQLLVSLPIPRSTCYVVHMRMLNFRESGSMWARCIWSLIG